MTAKRRDVRKVRYRTGNEEADRAFREIQEDVSQAVRSASDNAMSGSRRIDNVDIGVGDTNIPHKLGRAWKSWQVVSKSAAADVYEGTQVNASKFVTLKASVAVKVSLIVN